MYCSIHWICVPDICLKNGNISVMRTQANAIQDTAIFQSIYSWTSSWIIVTFGERNPIALLFYDIWNCHVSFPTLFAPC